MLPHAAQPPVVVLPLLLALPELAFEVGCRLQGLTANSPASIFGLPISTALMASNRLNTEVCTSCPTSSSLLAAARSPVIGAQSTVGSVMTTTTERRKN